MNPEELMTKIYYSNRTLDASIYKTHKSSLTSSEWANEGLEWAKVIKYFLNFLIMKNSIIGDYKYMK